MDPAQAQRHRRKAVQLQPDAGWQQAGPAGGGSGDEGGVQAKGPQGHRDGPVLRQAGEERSHDVHVGVRIQHDGRDVDRQESDDEDPQGLVPWVDPFRLLPLRLVGVAQRQAQDDHDCQEDENGDSGRARRKPVAHLGLVGGGRRHDLVGDDQDREARDGKQDGEGASAQPHARTAWGLGWPQSRMVRDGQLMPVVSHPAAKRFQPRAGTFGSAAAIRWYLPRARGTVTGDAGRRSRHPQRRPNCSRTARRSWP